jgi:hypothetical protein
MKSKARTICISIALAASMQFAAFAGQESNPATEKFQQDIKAAVLNGSITVPQLKELQENVEILKNVKAEQKPGAPVDLLTPHGAASRIKAIMATVKEPDRTTLVQDFQVVMANKKPPASSEPSTPGAKLGKDIFSAVMHGNPTDEQVKQLQESLNSLQDIKTSGDGKLQQLMTLKRAKTQIEQTMDAGSFRPQDRQAVLDDLNSLGPKGGGGGLRGRSS